MPHESAPSPVVEPSAAFESRRAAGRAVRERVPRSSMGPWVAPPDRTDPISLLEEQATTRVPDLVPIRHGRMRVSPFTFYRGAALLMASDLASTPHTGLTVQLCGDAHLSNFGLFGTPERRLTFDMNDFDETLPGPFEWDVKRLAASFAIAGRHRGFSAAATRRAVLAAARGYREAMRKSASSTVLDAWYDRLDADDARVRLRAEKDAQRVAEKQVRRFDEAVSKARTRDRMKAFAKLVHKVDGQLRIVADPPLIVPIEDLVSDAGTHDEVVLRGTLEQYQRTLQGSRHPVSEYRYRHMARKVVGVGSVGTRAWIILLTGRDDDDPLLLQAKEAQASVLERFLGASVYDNHGERVVRGQRAMQASSDIFLGWQRVTGIDGQERDFFLRQLHDWKGSIDPEIMTPKGAEIYARICGETLARAHARSGDRVEIAAYLGSGEVFDNAIADFSESYADQNDADFAAFTAAVDAGRLDAVSGL